MTSVIYDYIHNNYKKNITLDDVASLIDMSSQYTSKLFKELFEVNFTDYILELRIEAAKDRLTGSMMKIKDIAGEVGYDDANYFCRIFKKRIGMTPKEYRYG